MADDYSNDFSLKKVTVVFWFTQFLFQQVLHNNHLQKLWDEKSPMKTEKKTTMTCKMKKCSVGSLKLRITPERNTTKSKEEKNRLNNSGFKYCDLTSN